MIKFELFDSGIDVTVGKNTLENIPPRKLFKSLPKNLKFFKSAQDNFEIRDYREVKNSDLIYILHALFRTRGV